MLKGIPEILSPELLKVLCEMGHSDRIVIADGNFPSESMGKDAIVIRCDGHGVPEILDAILQVFPLDTYVENPVNLMQLMPETAHWIAGQMGLTRFDTQDLYRTDVNIRMGCWYVSELKHEFHNNMVLLMIAYNAGRGQTHTWMEANHWDYDFGSIDRIPYPDTKKYVGAVLRDRDEYYRLYKNEIEKESP